ncbi:hypothetical protein NP493_710g00029 [Ridgeia piscesae]|uniref:Methyltransferase n=1 Tax=Ridgeia piscesae TaxID=27915 RepID=A0AAD9KQL4_RIDPI|nr:hypothetical protein NP493_710g00029 [Ridgeia piscesae]
MRQDNSSDLANQYYDLATDFFEYGWGESFHFATMHKGESFEHAIAKHEYRIALKLRIEPGEKVLDMGCGVGGPARNIATFTEAEITGLNINDYQIQRARELTKAAGVDHLCEFVKGDFCKAPLESETFDKAYAIEASCHAADLSKVYREAYRMLKPGGLFASYEWVMTDKYDPTNPYHKQLKEEIMLGDGLPDINSIETVLHAVKSNGFELLETADMVEHSPVPWYSVMQPRWTLADFKITPLGRWLTHVALMGLELVGFAPSGSVKVHRTLCKGADSLVNGGKEGVFSPMFLVVARKPGKPTQ